MSIMLNESNSSFDTTPSFDFVMRHDDGRDDEVIASDMEDEDEEYDLVDRENERREDIGVLIVPPTTGSSEDSRNTVLSIPDSVPTVLNSGMLDLPDCVHVVDSVHPTPVRSNYTQGSIREDLNREIRSQKSKDDVVAGATQSAWRRNVLALLFVAAVSTGSVCHAFYLHRESLLLKEQVRLLTDQAARSAATLDELQQKQAREVLAMDNCWLQAYAKMSLGECSQEASETVKETVNSFGSSVYNFLEHMKEAYQENVKERTTAFDGFFRSNPANTTFGSTVHNFWERMQEAYQENVKGRTTAFEGFFRSNPANTTENICGAHVNAVLKELKKIKSFGIAEKVNTMGSNLQDIWNRTKGTLNTVNITGPLYTFGGDFSRFWVNIKVKDQVYDAGRSLYETPSTLFNLFKRGYSDLRNSFNESLYSEYMKWDTAESNTTLADVTEANLPDSYLHNANELQSLSKKVLIAAAWSAGAAILVSTFDMYWNQHGSFPAIEN